MSNDPKFYDFADFRRQPSPLRGSVSSQQSDSTPSSVWDSAFTPAVTPATSPPTTDRQYMSRPASDTTTTLALTAPVELSFVKGSKLFKLKYSKIDVCTDGQGNIRCIELTDPSMVSNSFIHTFTNSRRPVPHLELPATSTDLSLRVSFLEEQNVQISQTVFATQPHYTFENIKDSNRFQEAILGHSLLLVAGVAEIVSKGRGEEAISQNLRVWKLKTGSLTVLFFANSQRKEKKRYTTVSVNSINSIELPKKSGKPVHVKLDPDGDLTSQMKSLNILFLDIKDAQRFCSLLKENGVPVTSR